jgi:hypothetical protein
LDEREESDPELDNMIAQMEIAEYQVKKLQRILASTIDRSNPVTFSKGSSTYAFQSEGREYRVTIEADVFDIRDRPKIARSIRSVLKSPVFIITSVLFSAIICILALVSLYWTSPLIGTLSDRELDRLDRQYSVILDRCAVLMDDERPYNPRSFGALFAICNKAITQLQEFCTVHHHISTCEDERIELYIVGDKTRP